MKCPIYNYNKLQSNIFGLSCIPSSPIIGNFGSVDINVNENDDYPNSNPRFGAYHINHTLPLSNIELDKITEITNLYKHQKINIMEIGCFNPPTVSFSNILSVNKHSTSIYVGIDINQEKLNYKNLDKNINIIISDSTNQQNVRKQLLDLKVTNLSILFIDAFHSVASCINDWKYADLIVPGGKIILHDTNCHPGPKILTDVIDRNLFDVDICFENMDVWGLTVATKK